MLKIEIPSEKVHEKSGIAKVSLKPYCIREQDAYVHLIDRNGMPEKHPVKITVHLEREQPGYKPGFYTLLPQSFYVKNDRYGNTLELGRLALKPLAVAEQKAA